MQDMQLHLILIKKVMFVALTYITKYIIVRELIHVRHVIPILSVRNTPHIIFAYYVELITGTCRILVEL